MFDFLDMKSDGLNPDLIPYYFFDDEKVCPMYYNDVRIRGPPDFKEDSNTSKDKKEENDVFRVNQWLPPDDPNRIPKEYVYSLETN